MEKDNIQRPRRIKGFIVQTIFAFIIAVFIVFVLDYIKVISIKDIYNKITKFTQEKLLNGKKDSNAIIFKVGDENIYQKDLDYEMESYPAIKDIDVKKVLTDKLIMDSIILQGAQEDGFTKLYKGIFNSKDKNYSDRVSLVNAVKEKISERSSNISGSIVSLWFYNRGPGRVGYEKGREIAKSTIEKLHDEVIDKDINIQQAGQAIRNDPKLGYVDPAYLYNALLEFDKPYSEQVVFDKGFDEVIKKLRIGEVSDVYLAKSIKWEKNAPTSQMIDSVYMFAQVVDKEKAGPMGFDEWYKQKKKEYKVVYE